MTSPATDRARVTEIQTEGEMPVRVWCGRYYGCHVLDRVTGDQLAHYPDMEDTGEALERYQEERDGLNDAQQSTNDRRQSSTEGQQS